MMCLNVVTRLMVIRRKKKQHLSVFIMVASVVAFNNWSYRVVVADICSIRRRGKKKREGIILLAQYKSASQHLKFIFLGGRKTTEFVRAPCNMPPNALT